MEDFEQKTNFWQSLTKKQRWGLILLIIFTLFVLLFWFMLLRQSLIYPFYGGVSPIEFYKKTQEDSNNALTKEETRQIYLQNTDSDNDGLTDWEEETVYGTSPYLEDSDGDGVNDKEEILAGEDPNCPSGKECSENNLIFNEQSPTNNQQTQNIFPNLGNLKDLNLSEEDLKTLKAIQAIDKSSGANKNDSSNNSPSNSDGSGNTTVKTGNDSDIIKKILGNDPTADDIRKMLLKSGVPAEKFKDTSDEDLLNTFKDLVQ